MYLNNPIGKVLHALSDVTKKSPVQSGNGWKACCPAHDDKTPSLSVTEAEDGRVLLKCFAGCSTNSVLAALGLTTGDLFPDQSGTSQPPSRQTESRPRKTWLTSSEAIAALETNRGPRSADWAYHDNDGQEVGVVLRWDRADGRKDILPLASTVAGWQCGAMIEPRPLYRLSEVLKSDVVYVVEGEKAADAGCSIGLNCTTSSGGSNAPEKSDWSTLAGKSVVIIPDHDKPGRKYAETIAGTLDSLSCEVRIIDLSHDWPAITEKGDLDDWCEAHDAVEPEVLQQRIEALAANAEIWMAPQVSVDSHTDAESRDGWPTNIDMNAFHGLAGEFVGLVSPETEADVAALLIQFLTIFSGMAGRERFYPISGTSHHARLFSVAVGGTASGRKGTALDCVLFVMRQVDEDFCDENIVSGLTTGAGLLWHVRDQTAGDDDGGVTDKRCVAIESEFGSVLRASNRRENDLSAVLRDAWDGKSLRSLAKQQPARATDPHINVIGHITKEELKQTISSNDVSNGLANRILWYGSKRSQLLPDGGDLQQVELGELVNRIRTALQFERFPGRMTRSNAARKRWHEIYPRLTEPRPGAFGQATTRAEAQVLRLSMVFALLDQSDEIELIHLEAALAVWNYAESSARWVFGNSTGNKVADQILEALRNSDSLSRSEISALFGGNRNSGVIQNALRLLDDLKLAQRDKSPGSGRGRPPECWSAT